MTAIRNIALLLSSAIATGVVMAYSIHFFGLAVVGTALSFAMLAYLIKIVYDIEVDKAKSLEKLNNPRG